MIAKNSFQTNAATAIDFHEALQGPRPLAVSVISAVHKDLLQRPPEVTPPKKQTIKEWSISVALLLFYVMLSVGAGQLSNLSYTDKRFDFRAPFLFVQIKTVFRCLAFPVYLLINTIVKLFRGRSIHYARTWKRCLAICGDGGLTWRVLFVKFLPPMVCNLAVQVLYTFGTQYLSASLGSALGPPAIAMSYLLSWIFLKTPLLLIKILFVLVVFSGVIVICCDQMKLDFDSRIIIGICALLLADLALSCYQLLFKKSFPKGDMGQISFAISVIYLLSFVVYFPVPIILHETGVEKYNMTDLPYHYLIGASSCVTASTMIYGYGLVVAGGFFMGLSDLLIMASNTGIDVLRGISLTSSQLIGTGIISGAFLVLVLPERYVSIEIRKRLEWLRCFDVQQLPGIFRRRWSRSDDTEIAPTGRSIHRIERGLSSVPWLDLFGLNADEDDVMEKKDLHVADGTQLKLGHVI